MYRLSLIYFTFAFILVACSPKGEYYCRLVKADSLLYNSFVDSAYAELVDIDPQSSADSAYYFVLKAQIDFRKNKTPLVDQLDYSIRYYQNNFDSRKLAEAYYYKVCYYISSDILPNEAFVLLKKAESLADQTSDVILKYKICSAFAFANHTFGELEEALKYAKKELLYAETFGCHRDNAYALIRLSSTFRDLGERDSAELYAMWCQKLINDVDEEDKSYIYILWGECFMSVNIDIAELYFLKSLKFKKLPRSYMGLANICNIRGDTLRWRQYCDSALNNAWCSLKIDIFLDMAKVYFDCGSYQNSKCAADSAIAALRAYYQSERENYVLDIQKKFDFERQQTAYEHKMHIFWIVIACLVLVVAVIAIISLLFVHKIRLRNTVLEKDNVSAYGRQEELNCRLEEYNAQIDYLQKQNQVLSEQNEGVDGIIASNKTALAKLQQKLDSLSEQSNEVLAEGKMVYDKIKAGESIAKCKDKFAACFYYFERTFPEQLVIFKPYNYLTMENRIFLIADDQLHKSDNEMSKIFDIALSTVRTRRNKLKFRIL